MDHTTSMLIDALHLMDHRLATRLHAAPASAQLTLSRESVEAFRNLARRMAARLQRQETEMGKAAQAIGVLQGQLTTAQANEYDAADLAAIQGVLGTPAAPANQSSGSPVADTTAAGTGTDTTAARAGTDATPAAPANQSSGSPVTDATPSGTAASGAGTDSVPASS